ncbi:MAG: hypothetical protein ACREIF_06800 [Chthoniobacterales bacterium]
MKAQYIREFIAAIYECHGWPLSLVKEDGLPIDDEVDQSECKTPRFTLARA